MKGMTFLALAEVIEIHADQIEQYGGRSGIKDINLLTSAVAVPCATFAGDFLHRDIFEMAAAYAFHVSQNHPFVDGNKRTALASALVFLQLNGIGISDPDEKLYESMIKIASGTMIKEELAVILRNLAD
jgi:death-on-curing protein